MKIRYLFGKNDLNEQEEKHLDKKIEKIKKRFKEYEDDEVKMNIKIDRDKRSFWIVELMIRSSHEVFRAERRDGDFMTAVDMVCGVIMRQVRR